MQKVNYKQELDNLFRLQELDTQLYSLKRENEEKPKILETLSKEFEQKKQILKDFEERSKSLLLKRKEKEGELALKEENIKKLQSQLYSLKTNKEYSTMLNEINGVKMDKSLIEEDILKIFDEQDKLKNDLEKQNSLIKEEEIKFQHKKQEILDRIKNIEEKIKDLESQRAVAENEITPQVLLNYNRILKGKNGLALVKVENNSCQGCFINVTHQVINEIKMNDKLVFCEMCARILYIPDEPAQ